MLKMYVLEKYCQIVVRFPSKTHRQENLALQKFSIIISVKYYLTLGD